ncbi:helix-turn-helix transcriptional regulator [Bradyrhizobium sp. USDA 3315]
MVDDPFIENDDTLTERSHLSDLTRRRLEKRQRFPKRIKLSTRRTVYRRSEFEAWLRDPEAWQPATLEAVAS